MAQTHQQTTKENCYIFYYGLILKDVLDALKNNPKARINVAVGAVMEKQKLGRDLRCLDCPKSQDFLWPPPN